MKLENMKVGTRLYLGFSLPLVLIVIVIMISISNMGYIQQKLDRIINVNNVRAGLADEMGKMVRENAISLRNILLVKDHAKRQDEKKKIDNARARYDGAFKTIEEKTPKDDTKAHEIITKTKGNQDTARALNNKVIEMSLSNKDNEANDLMEKEARPAVRKWLDSVDELSKYQEERSRARYEESVKTYASARQYMYGLGGIAIILAGLIAFIITRSITKPITRVSEGLSDGAEQVASASSQVSSASQSLAEGASEQAAGIEETSSSIEEMSSMTKQNADNANHANTLMAETTRVVDEANRSMSELTGSMKEISTASEETAKIIKTIDEIAFQTNLLALNAAVEAARAGEAGAGFAVVADEVRNLAMRAADAAKNTANLIEGTVKKIKNGSDIVTKTNEAFGKVATGAKKVGELVGEISAASNEQAQGVEQINKAVAEMDKVVQKNAASAEESASAAEEMNAQAEQMKGFVGELVAMVAGSNGNGVVSDRALSHKGGGGGHVRALIHHPKFDGKKVQAAPVKKGKEMMAPVPKGKEVKPDQVIPMGEADFKEF